MPGNSTGRTRLVTPEASPRSEQDNAAAAAAVAGGAQQPRCPRCRERGAVRHRPVSRPLRDARARVNQGAASAVNRDRLGPALAAARVVGHPKEPPPTGPRAARGAQRAVLATRIPHRAGEASPLAPAGAPRCPRAPAGLAATRPPPSASNRRALVTPRPRPGRRVRTAPPVRRAPVNANDHPAGDDPIRYPAKMELPAARASAFA